MTHGMTDRDSIAAWAAAAAAHVNDFDDEGDGGRRHLLNPAIFALLGEPAGRRVLDAGCGQGYLCRLLARRGARVTGIEPAQGWVEAARAAEEADPRGIVYLRADLTAPTPEVGALAPFDAVIASMVLMDIVDDAAALRTCVALLRPGGDLILALCHPCFEEEAERWGAQGFVAVREYLGEYVITQVIAQRIHRPLSHYLNLLIESGCELRQVLEPRLDPAWEARGRHFARNVHVPSFLVLAARRK